MVCNLELKMSTHLLHISQRGTQMFSCLSFSDVPPLTFPPIQTSSANISSPAGASCAPLNPPLGAQTNAQVHSPFHIYNIGRVLFPMSDGIVICCQPFLSLASICSFIYRALHRPGLTSAMGKHVALVMTVCVCVCVCVGGGSSVSAGLIRAASESWMILFPISRAWSCFSVDLHAEHWDIECRTLSTCYRDHTTISCERGGHKLNTCARCVRGERECEHCLDPQVSVHDSKHSTVLYVNVPFVPHTLPSAHSWLEW